MALKLGPLRLPWSGSTAADDDPYWDFFINQPAADPRNAVTEIIRRAPESSVFPTLAELHSPEVTSEHVKELARFLYTDLVGIVRLTGRPGQEDHDYPFGIVNVTRA